MGLNISQVPLEVGAKSTTWPSPMAAGPKCTYFLLFLIEQAAGVPNRVIYLAEFSGIRAPNTHISYLLLENVAGGSHRHFTLTTFS